MDGIAELARDLQVDAVVAVGGGATVDLGKAVAAMIRHPGSVTDYLEGVGTEKPTGDRVALLAAPTSAGTGSEATKNAVISQVGLGGFKKSLRHEGFVPDTAVLDPELSLDLPVGTTVATGLDAITQLLEAYVSTKANPMTEAVSERGLALAGEAFPRLVAGEHDVDARGKMALAAFFSGVALASGGLGVVHGMAGPFGGRYPIPHGVVCGWLVSPATDYLLDHLEADSSVLRRFSRAGDLLAPGPGDGIDRLRSILRRWSGAIDFRLSDYGLDPVTAFDVAENSDDKQSPLAVGPKGRREIVSEAISRLGRE